MEIRGQRWKLDDVMENTNVVSYRHEPVTGENPSSIHSAEKGLVDLNRLNNKQKIEKEGVDMEPEFEVVKIELQLTFFNSLNKTHTIHLKTFESDLTDEEIYKNMEMLSFLDQPDAKGICQCAVPYEAKYVQVREKVIFQDPEPVILADMLPPMPKQKDPMTASVTTPGGEVVVEQKAERTIVSVADMTRLSPGTIAKAMKKDLAENDNDPESQERYLRNAIRTQVLNNLLWRTNRLHPLNFQKPIQEMTDQTQWPDFLINYLDELKPFYTEAQWLEVMKKYQKIGKEGTARLMAGADGKPNYAQAKLHMNNLLADAKVSYQAFLNKEREFKAQLAKSKWAS